jgi:hypothetical protein
VQPDAPLFDQFTANPQSWNLYTYGRNNPLSGTDPTGRAWKIFHYAWKVAQAAYKGQDMYQTVKGLVDSGKTVFSPNVNVTTTDRLKASASFLGELSGASDVVKGVRSLRTTAGVVDAGDLKRRADTIANAAPSQMTRDKVTISVGDASSTAGDQTRLVASSEGSLRNAHVDALQPGEVAVEGVRGTHAEVNLLNAAQEQGLKVTAVAASKPICEGCAAKIEQAGAVAVSELKKGKP